MSINNLINTDALIQYLLQKKSIYQEQLNATKKIEQIFQTYNSSYLVAEMQSGKTGTYQLLAAIYLIHFAVKNIQKHKEKYVYIILAESSNELLNDLKLKFYELTRCVGEFISADYVNMLREQVVFVHRSQITNKKNKKIRNQYVERLKNNKIGITIIDESHMAREKNSKVFSDLKFIWNKYEYSEHKKLFVSATPFLDLWKKENQNFTEKQVVYLKPGENYYGIKYMLDNNLIEQSPPIFVKKKLNKFFVQLIKNGIDTPSYFIVRVHNQANAAKLIKEIKNTMGNDFAVQNLDFVLMNASGSGHITGIIYHPISASFFEKKPDRFTIVLLLNSFRAGNTIKDKSYIRYIYEEPSKYTDVVVQSLLGRMCGYYLNPPQIKCFVNYDAAKEYVQAIKAIYNFINFKDTTNYLNEPLHTKYVKTDKDTGYVYKFYSKIIEIPKHILVNNLLQTTDKSVVAQIKEIIYLNSPKNFNFSGKINMRDINVKSQTSRNKKVIFDIKNDKKIIQTPNLPELMGHEQIKMGDISVVVDFEKRKIRAIYFLENPRKAMIARQITRPMMELLV